MKARCANTWAPIHRTLGPVAPPRGDGAFETRFEATPAYAPTGNLRRVGSDGRSVPSLPLGIIPARVSDPRFRDQEPQARSDGVDVVGRKLQKPVEGQAPNRPVAQVVGREPAQRLEAGRMQTLALAPLPATVVRALEKIATVQFDRGHVTVAGGLDRPPRHRMPRGLDVLVEKFRIDHRVRRRNEAVAV